jgi:hypothetical protein
MKEKGIKFMLVQIDEAHSSKWPLGLPDQVEPQKSFDERIERAQTFSKDHDIKEPFKIMIDGWDNEFANRFRAWPDKYYLVDPTYKLLAKSEYGRYEDALIDVDCIVHILRLIKEND